MVFVACGLNHKTAPLNIREKAALLPHRQDSLLSELVYQSKVREALILSTCNRTEIYCETEEPLHLIDWFSEQQNLTREQLKPYLYMHHGQEGLRHTLRVAAGLDSMMLGEPQILGQMKQAYQNARELGAAKSGLRDVFEYVFSASKRIRSNSGIGTNPVSIAYAAVQLVSQLFNDFSKLKVFLIGSGETATLVAKYLHKQGVNDFLVASRSQENADELAQSFNGKGLTITEIPQYLAEADVVISATACPLPFINKSLVKHALLQRENAPMFFLDLAVPRDIEPEVAELEDVHLYNIDDLQNMIEIGMKERQRAALKAEQLIESEIDNYIRLHRSLKAKDIICTYRTHMQKLAEYELQRAQDKLLNGSNHEIVLREFCDRLVNKLTHYPTIGFREAAKDGREEILELVHYLFNSTANQTLYEEIS
ncbi:MAG: glutamyl-tRNA reductase [Proteobacteria bacterium]|nr:glutamyl-tRNA reductase [Pseudomonadota bacterium]